MRVPLPSMTRQPGAQAHLYPIQVAIQTQEFMHTTNFHHMIMDTAAGQRVRETSGMQEIENELTTAGLDLATLREGWDYLNKYKDIFNEFIRHNVLILQRSHWDWYIEKMGFFVIHARDELGPPLSNNERNDLEKLGFKSIRKQIEILEKTTGETFNFESDTMDNAVEMSLVRNLGIHNRWEVNSYYLSTTQSSRNWEEGEIRQFEMEELNAWYSSLIDMTHKTAFPIAKLFRAASDYPATR